jgi:hypothetical protein
MEINCLRFWSTGGIIDDHGICRARLDGLTNNGVKNKHQSFFVNCLKNRISRIFLHIKNERNKNFEFYGKGNKLLYSILVNNRLYTPPNEGINWPLWLGFVKNLPSNANGWFNYSNNDDIKHYLIKENHRLYTQ